MDIASLSTAMATEKIGSQFSVEMLKKTMDTQKTEGEGVIAMMDASAAMMERSVNPHVGGNFDMSV